MVSETTEFKSVGANEESAEAFGSRVRSAVIWRSGSQILAQIITWASTLLVIRLLDPSDYGLFAMTQVVLSFLAFLNGWGFARALVQRSEERRGGKECVSTCRSWWWWYQ